MEKSENGGHAILHSYEFFMRILLIIELNGTLLISEGRMYTMGTLSACDKILVHTCDVEPMNPPPPMFVILCVIVASCIHAPMGIF